MTRTPALDASRRALNTAARRAAARPRRADGRRLAIRLWLPLTPLFMLLAPFALAGAAVGVVFNAPIMARRRPPPTDLRSVRRSYTPSTPTRGEEELISCSPLVGELSAKPTEGGLRGAGSGRAGARIARPWRAAWALGGLLLSLSGTLVEVETPTALIRLHIL